MIRSSPGAVLASWLTRTDGTGYINPCRGHVDLSSFPSISSMVDDTFPLEQYLTSLNTSPMSCYLVILAGTVFLGLRVSEWIARSRRLPLPPGPKGIPILGNLLQVLGFKSHPWIMYRDLSKEYGVSEQWVIRLTLVVDCVSQATWSTWTSLASQFLCSAASRPSATFSIDVRPTTLTDLRSRHFPCEFRRQLQRANIS